MTRLRDENTELTAAKEQLQKQLSDHSEQLQGSARQLQQLQDGLKQAEHAQQTVNKELQQVRISLSVIVILSKHCSFSFKNEKCHIMKDMQRL